MGVRKGVSPWKFDDWVSKIINVVRSIFFDKYQCCESINIRLLFCMNSLFG